MCIHPAGVKSHTQSLFMIGFCNQVIQGNQGILKEVLKMLQRPWTVKLIFSASVY